jgi:putative DNA methylase
MPVQRKKLIEVALPLDAINREAAREKSIRHGHPSTLHLWWARRPLAAARAMIFTSMVDDPASVPEDFPTEEMQEAERKRLFLIIEELVKWKNTTNERILNKARAEIRKSWARWCIESGEDPEKLPPFHDPFAGGGSLPLEAQRLGLEAHASDLNPVAVMICKAMIEIPPRFAGRPPLNREARTKIGGKEGWKGASALAEDVRYYGTWMRAEAEKRIGHLYPKVTGYTERGTGKYYTEEEAAALPASVTSKLSPASYTVIAWLWARTVASPNPAFAGIHVPLISSFWLSSKPGKEAWIELIVNGKSYRFEVRTGEPEDKTRISLGTKLGRGANFRCVLSNSPIAPNYIRREAQAGRMSVRLMAIVAERDGGRVYLPPIDKHMAIAQKADPKWKPDQKVTSPCHDVDRLPMYGMYTWGDAFTARQLLALTTLVDLVSEAREKVRADALFVGLPDDRVPLREGGSAPTAYAEALSVYLAFAVSKASNLGSSITSWMSDRGAFRETFARQAIPMVWDYAEANPFSDSGGSVSTIFDKIAKVIEAFPAKPEGFAEQVDAASAYRTEKCLVSTDPPYYDNIGYADLSDFFYVWMRPSLQPVYPELFSTLLVPKADELVASQYRHGSKGAAEQFFLDGMTRAMHMMAERAHPGFPVIIYYAFKQSERGADGVSSTGWETFLEAVLRAGFCLTGTWPTRTEGSGRIVALGTNALASSIVLVCRPRPTDAPMTTRRDFLNALKRELPPALHHLQKSNIAPVDLAQASIGPGMAIFSRYSKILESDGTGMRVRTALALINQALDEVLAEQEGDFDAETGWAVAWFDEYGFNDGRFGEAETLSKAKNTAVNALVEAGLVKSGAGKVRLLRVDELPKDWDPMADKRLTVWETVHHLIRTLNTSESSAADLLARLGAVGEQARELAYRLYTICERRKRATEAQAYNALVLSWPEIAHLAQERRTKTQEQKSWL